MCSPSRQNTHVPSDHSEGRDDEIAGLHRPDVVADGLDDADELVAHAPAALAGSMEL